jgi:choline dehydrogenase-like flavoprotein
MQVIAQNQEVFDAVIVGSGATGGWAAKHLTEAGMKVETIGVLRNVVGTA